MGSLVVFGSDRIFETSRKPSFVTADLLGSI
jgi:hypothetical protein